MKISVAKNALLEALQKVGNLVGSRTTLPILANVMLEAKDGILIMTTTDLEARITTRIEADVAEPGVSTLPAKRFTALVSRFIAPEVSIEIAENHHATLECGTYSGTMFGLPDNDFPLPQETAPVRTIEMPASDMTNILDRISYAVSLDDSRKVLHGILISVKDGGMTCVATDGKRLALVERILDDGSDDGGDIDAILPLKGANELRRILAKEDKVEIKIGEKQISFTTAGSSLTAKRIEGSYPNYRQIIPKTFSKAIILPVEEFLASLELVSTAIADSNSFVRISFGGNQAKLEASSAEIGAGSDHLDIDYNDSELMVSFNPHFLADPFKKLGADKVTLKANDNSSPVVLEGGEGFLYVIMPMRGN